MKCRTFVALLAAGLAFPCVSFGALYHEDFNDGAAAGRWSVAWQLEATRDAATVEDGSVNFAFDYSTLGIANPNGGADTIGAFIQVNNTDQVGDEGETYIIYPNGLDFTGDFILQADMFVYNDGGASGAGTTELGMAGLFLDNANPVAPYQWGTAGGPLAWIYSGEGGSAADLATFEEGNAAATGYTPIDDYNNVPAGTIPGFETGAAGSLGPGAAPNTNGSWVDVRIESVGDTINWYLNGALVDSYDNSGGFYTGGNIFLGTTDPFNSVNSGGGVIIDNVQVIPEPAALLICLMGAIGLLVQRRR